MKIERSTYLISLFTSPIDLSDKAALCSNAKKALSIPGLQETILGLPDDAPQNFPRILLNTDKKRDFQIEIFPNRINVTVSAISMTLENIINQLDSLVNCIGANTIRVALVRSFQFGDLERAPVELIGQHLLQGEARSGCTDVQLNYLVPVQVADFNSNLWTRHAALRSTDGEPYYFLEFDINTVVDDKSTKTVDQIRNFLSAAEELLLNKKGEYERIFFGL